MYRDMYRFNKAAANRCGSHQGAGDPSDTPSRFNKAAANRCGSQGDRRALMDRAIVLQ